MNKVVFIEALGKLIEGLTLIQSALKEDVPPMTGVPMSAVAVGGESKAVPVTHTPAQTAVGETQATPTPGVYTREQLDAMPYNEFKKLAAKLGVKCTGSRGAITARVLEKTGNAVTDSIGETAPETEEIKSVTEKPVRKIKVSVPPEIGVGVTATLEEVTPPKSDKLPGSKRGLKKATPVPAKDEFDTKAEEVAKNTTVDDIIDALKSVGVKATAKDYMSKLADALRQNLLSVEDDDDDTETPATPVEGDEDETEDAAEEDTASEGADEETADEDDEDDEISADSYFSQYDPEGFNNPVDMSDKRKDAVVEAMDAILTDVSEGKLTPEEIQNFLEENATQDELDLLGDEPTEDDMLKLYMELKKRLIDNDGDMHEREDPYELGEYDMCCGHKLKYVEKSKKYVCELCGTEYEAE